MTQEGGGRHIHGILREPSTLGVDIGGTAVKAGVLDASAAVIATKPPTPTPYPLQPVTLVHVLTTMADQLPAFDRITLGFPGAVRGGRVWSAPHFVSPAGPGGDRDAALAALWIGFDLVAAVSQSLGRPTRMLNDADVHGLAVVRGEGLELVVTLGAGVGTALFFDGELAPHLELATHPFNDNQTYNDWLGERTRRRIGAEQWNARLRTATEVLYELLQYDQIYLGGGNERHIRGRLDARAVRIGNHAGIEGAVGAWREPPPWGTR